MINLFLCRHAKSSWADTGLRDIERPLNERGKFDAPLMGEILKNKQESADLILSSPAKRAFKTAKIIAEKIGYDLNDIEIEDDLYMAGTNDFLNVLEKINSKNKNIMLFSHNFGITDFANYISNSKIANIPTCGIVKINFSFSDWKKIKNNKGTLQYFIYPKMFKHGS
ncbi:MAG: histidine phosphatase family protein [Ignavibacteria bacterium]|nr:histidine phosphatase family protein [Ignavibacteria bacterium]